MSTIKHIYRLSWRLFETPIKDLLRFYFSHQDITIDQLSAASSRAWSACYIALSHVSEPEQDKIRMLFTGEIDSSLIVPSEQAAIRRVCRIIAETLGIADISEPLQSDQNEGVELHN